jgi:hypothetical protein
MSDGAPAGDITAAGELAARPYVTDAFGLPQVVVVSRDIEGGTRVSAMRRNVEPALGAQLPTLPNPIVIPKPEGPPASATPPPTGAPPAPGSTPSPPEGTPPAPPATAPAAPPPSR